MRTVAKVSMQRGPTSERVRANLRALRTARGLDLEDVSNKLVAIGWPISVSGVSKIELGQRRVDVDDLVALSQVLEVSVPLLLFESPLKEAVQDAKYEHLLAEIEEAKLRGALAQAEAKVAAARQRSVTLEAELAQQEVEDGDDGEHQ